MKQNNNTKKHKETVKTNNELKSLILRYDGVQEWYIKEANAYLLREHKTTFAKAYVSKVVNGTLRLTPTNYIIKEALEFIVTDWGRKIGSLKEDESLVATPKGVKVIRPKAIEVAEPIAA